MVKARSRLVVSWSRVLFHFGGREMVQAVSLEMFVVRLVKKPLESLPMRAYEVGVCMPPMRVPLFERTFPVDVLHNSVVANVIPRHVFRIRPVS